MPVPDEENEGRGQRGQTFHGKHNLHAHRLRFQPDGVYSQWGDRSIAIKEVLVHIE